MKRRLTLITLCIVMVLTTCNNVWGAAITNSNDDKSSVIAVNPKPLLGKEQAVEIAQEKDNTVSDMVEPVQMQFDKKQFMNAISYFIDTYSWFDEIKDMNEYIITDITFDGMPEFIVGSYGSSTGSIWVYDLTQTKPYSVGSSETKSPELHNYINKTTGKPVCVITENSRLGSESWIWTSEILSYKGKLYSDPMNWIPTKSLYSTTITSTYDGTETKKEIQYEISNNINIALTDIEILERIMGFDYHSGLKRYANITVTKDEYDKTLAEYYDNLYELPLPYVNSGVSGSKEENELRTLLKEMVDTYIESCETTAETQDEWFVFDIVND